MFSYFLNLRGFNYWILLANFLFSSLTKIKTAFVLLWKSMIFTKSKLAFTFITHKTYFSVAIPASM